MITIRPYRSTDKEALYAMLAEVWPDETAQQHDRRWWWQKERCPLWLAVDDGGTVAGMCGHIPFEARHDAGIQRGAWIVDFFVRHSFQGQGIGKRMVRAIEAHFDFLASLNQTDAAYAAFSRAGWTERRTVPFMISASPSVYRIATSLQGSLGLIVASGPPVFDASFDALWNAMPPGVPSSVRNSSALASRFGTSDRDYRLVRALRGADLVGYFILRVLPPGSIKSFSRFPIMIVSDYLTDPSTPDVFRALMRETVRLASEERVRFVLCMSNHASHQRALSGGGFLSPATPLIGARLRKLAVGFTATPSAPAGQWQLTPFDCDLDILFGVGA